MSKRIELSSLDIESIKGEFPFVRTIDLARRYGVSEYYIHKLCHSCGIVKDSSYLRDIYSSRGRKACSVSSRGRGQYRNISRDRDLLSRYQSGESLLDLSSSTGMGISYIRKCIRRICNYDGIDCVI